MIDSCGKGFIGTLLQRNESVLNEVVCVNRAHSHVSIVDSSKDKQMPVVNQAHGMSPSTHEFFIFRLYFLLVPNVILLVFVFVLHKLDDLIKVQSPHVASCLAGLGEASDEKSSSIVLEQSKRCLHSRSWDDTSHVLMDQLVSSFRVHDLDPVLSDDVVHPQVPKYMSIVALSTKDNQVVVMADHRVTKSGSGSIPNLGTNVMPFVLCLIIHHHIIQEYFS